MGIQFSQSYSAVRKRIKRLPQLVKGVAEAQRKRDAENLVKYWREGIQNRTFRLKPLSPLTIRQKKQKGYSSPSTPLLGKGLGDKRSYINGMRVYKKKNGWAVRMSTGKHHSSDLPLNALFQVHEYGATIDTGTAVIVIPARPAMAKAYQKVMKEIKANDPNKEIAKVCDEFVKTGKTTRADRIKFEAKSSGAENA